MYLESLLQSRGLTSERFKTLETGYRNMPTPLQASSYGPVLVEHVRNGDIEALEKMLQAGISPNPCSATGESLIHLICRRGESKMLKLFLNYGASIQVSDSLGRTPLHEAVSATCAPFVLTSAQSRLTQLASLVLVETLLQND
jgi:ankyrin repeat protein